MSQQFNRRFYRGISLIELVLVLVAIGFVTLSGVQFIAGRIEQNKVLRAADQIEGWLLAAQAYYRDQIQIDPPPPSFWPKDMSDMYPYIADSTVQNKFDGDGNNPTFDPWHNQYSAQPHTNIYQPPTAWNNALSANNIPPNPTTADLAFFTLQVPVANKKRGIAIISQLPNARLATDGKGNYWINAFIPPPGVVKSAIGHQLVMNMGVVKTKGNDQMANHSYYNYTVDDYSFDLHYQSASQRFLKPEYAGDDPLSEEKIRSYGAVFIAKPKNCPGKTQPYIQASVASFGISQGYSSRYNSGNYLGYGSSIPSEATIQSTTPVKYANGNNGNLSGNNLSDGFYFPYFSIDTSPSDSQYFFGSNNSSKINYTDNGSSSINKALGGIIGVHVKSSPLQSFIDDQGNVNDSIQGWYLWLDITVNMAMYPNYPTESLPTVIQDCAMNINTQTDDFPYTDTGSTTSTGYNYIPQKIIQDPTTNEQHPMIATDLIVRSAIPLYQPSPCHFHSGYIAYITSCASSELAQANGLDLAQHKLKYW